MPIHTNIEMPARRVGRNATIGPATGAASNASNIRHHARRISHVNRWLPESPSYRVWSKSNTTSGASSRGAGKRVALMRRTRVREQMAQRHAWIRLAHEGLADQERMHAGIAHQRDVGRRQDAAFGDQHAVARHRVLQVERGLQRHLEGAQVAVVDAEQARRHRQRTLEFVEVVHLDQHVHAEFAGDEGELRQLHVIQRRGDQQHAVGAERARLVHLVRIDDEILAQHRQARRPRAPATRYASAPWKKSTSVSTDRQAAPPAS